MRVWITRALMVAAIGLGLWGVADILTIFSLNSEVGGHGYEKVLLALGILKLVVSLTLGTIAIKRG